MIKHIEFAGIHTEVTPELQKYARKKIGKMDKYLPRHARESARAQIIIKESNQKKGKKTYTCEVILFLPQENVTVKQSTINPFAAIDIAEDTLKNRLKKYKETHGSERLHKRVLARLRRQSGGQIEP